MSGIYKFILSEAKNFLYILLFSTALCGFKGQNMSLNVNGLLNDDVYPFRAVAYVTSWWGNYAAQGSAALIGKNDVLTAAHVVFDKARGGWADRVEVRFSYDPSESPGAVYRPVDFRGYTNFDLDGNGRWSSGDRMRGSLAEAELDLAILSLDANAGDTFGWFGWSSRFDFGSATLLGFPAINRGYLTGNTLNFTHDSIDSAIHFSSPYSLSGNSGGPVVVSRNGDPIVVGVLSTTSVATSLRDHSDFITAWTNINDAFATPGVDIFRLYNSITGHHLYTTSTSEALHVATNLENWSYEGIRFGVSASGGDTPIYRLYNSETGRHLYTASIVEMRSVDARREWDLEGIAFNAHRAPSPGRDEVFRFFNTQTGAHFYTSSEIEASMLRTDSKFSSFQYEGIAFYTDISW